MFTKILLFILISIVGLIVFYFLHRLQMRAWLDAIEQYFQQKQKNHEQKKKE